MKDVLLKILTAAVLKSLEMNNGLDTICFKNTINLLVQQDNLLQSIPKSIVQDMDRLREIETKAGNPTGLIKDLITKKGQTEDNAIVYYPQKGILFYDGIYGSAFGRMSYIYRSKGCRVYLFEDLKMDLVSTYCTIDHNGFQLINESCYVEMIDLKDKNNFERCDEVFSSMGISDTNFPLEMLRLLANVKEPFLKDYYIEYLLSPPDVDKISTFSTEVRELLWDICLSKKFLDDYGKTGVYKAIELLVSINVTPTPLQLIEFIEQQGALNVTELMEDVNIIKQLLQNKPIYSGKIGISSSGLTFGEVDFRELIRRIKINMGWK